MDNLKLVPVHVAARAFFAAAGMVLLSSASVYADPGPNNPGNHYGKYDNPGNHYGQIYNPGNHYAYGRFKHQPTPTPPPVPTPTPHPGPHPTSHPAVTPAGDLGTGSTVTTDDTSNIPDLPVVLPPQNTPQVQLTDAAAGNDQEWMLLLVLPALLAVWAIVAARLAQRALSNARRRRMVTAPA